MRKVFFSFDWDDAWRANQVRNNWISKDNYELVGFVDTAEIETIKKQEKVTIQKWIDEQIRETSVTCFLIGNKTNKSKWVQYEVNKSIEKGNGLLGILIHELKDFGDKPDKEGEKSMESPLGNKGSFGEKVKKVLDGGGVGLGLTRLVLPQFTIPLSILGAALSFLGPDEDYKIYNWIEDDGYKNIGYWIEEAAQQVRK